MTRRVVVTGVGMVTPLHPTTEGSWEALVAGQSGVGYVSRYELGEDFPVRIAAEVKGFDPLLYIDKKDLRKMDLFIQYAVAATEQALEWPATGSGPRRRTGSPSSLAPASVGSP